MTDCAIKFGTSGWRGIIAEEFTFANVRIAVAAIADHVLSRNRRPTLIVAHDTRFFSEQFGLTAAQVLDEHGVHSLIANGATPTPTVAHEIRRRKVEGAINFTASHNPAEYHGLKFSGIDGGPASPEVTRDIERHCAKLASRGTRGISTFFPSSLDARMFEQIDPAPAYLERLSQLVRFETIRKAGITIVYDALHGCGAGYLDRALADHGIKVQTIHAARDVLFGGIGPDVSEAHLAPLSRTVQEHRAQLGLATDGDADRFGIIDAEGRWVSPNHILGLVYDYLMETRGWHSGAARSVATSPLIDAVARLHGSAVKETPVGFKFIGRLILEDGIDLACEESAGLSIRGHVPEKDGILACLLVAEMVAARGVPIYEQLRDLFRRVGREFWPLRTNLQLSEQVRTTVSERLRSRLLEFRGRHVVRTDRTDGLKMVFGDDSWILMRLSGTEPFLRVYTEAATREEAIRLASDARQWIFAAAAGGTS